MKEERGSQKQIAGRYLDQVESYNARSPLRRTRFWLSFLALVGGSAALFLAREKVPNEFFNTGPLSRAHSALQQDCRACHTQESLGGIESAPARFAQVLGERFHHGAPAYAQIDRACASCHVRHDFHQPNVMENRSCSACHAEHQGPGPMLLATSGDCASCHNDRGIMRSSAEAGRKISPSEFRLNPKVADAANARPNILRLPRPADGYTMTFASFSEGHPAFQLQRENFRESDALRFNHQRHLAGAGIPLTGSGAKLDCIYCHKTDGSGRYMERISFAANCQECHALQFDVKNPDFQLPHGDAQLVRTFLRTLPAQYAELGRRRGLTSDSRVNEFATQQVRQLLTQFPNAQELERTVFFTRDPYKPSQSLDPKTRAKFTGCAFCHEVKQAANVSYPTAEIALPPPVDRWLPHAYFDHAKHAGVASCRDCHAAAAASQLTSDALLPTKESCVRCHSPKGMAAKASECATCHSYHSTPPAFTLK